MLLGDSGWDSSKYEMRGRRLVGVGMHRRRIVLIHDRLVKEVSDLYYCSHKCSAWSKGQKCKASGGNLREEGGLTALTGSNPEINAYRFALLLKNVAKFNGTP